jgi:hypothetical protein
MIRGMLARLAIAVLALFTGGFQVVDGIHALVTGRYIGPETPGPWRHVVRVVGLEPLDMKVPFLVLGSAWLAVATALLVTSSTVAWWALLVIAVLTLWYLPVGTANALATIAILVLARTQLTNVG